MLVIYGYIHLFAGSIFTHTALWQTHFLHFSWDLLPGSAIFSRRGIRRLSHRWCGKYLGSVWFWGSDIPKFSGGKTSSIKNWMGPYPRTPQQVPRVCRYPGWGVHSVGPVGDFLDIYLEALGNTYECYIYDTTSSSFGCHKKKMASHLKTVHIFHPFPMTPKCNFWRWWICSFSPFQWDMYSFPEQ